MPADCRAEWRRHPADLWKQRRPVRRGAQPPCWFATCISQTRKSPLKTRSSMKALVHGISKRHKCFGEIQCCRSGMFITDPDPNPDFYPSRILDSTIAKKERGNTICSPTFFVASILQYCKLFYFWTGNKIISQFTKIRIRKNGEI